jgi:DNA ligase (NAD+)
MDKLNRIKELTEILHKASVAYYQYDNPIMSDKQYDDLYDELEQLERNENVILAGSPTQKVQGYILKGLEKQKHSKPMLSAAKTKDINEIKKFINWRDFYGSYKLDGLTLVVIYEDGVLNTALTRGSGEFGEIVTEQAKMISNLPKEINHKERLEIRGECVVSWDNFNFINSKLKEPFSHPRNMAAGSIRNLDTNVARDRMLEFVAFECVTDIGIDSKFSTLQKLKELGFTIVENIYGEIEEGCPVDYIVENMTSDKCKYAVDGLIFELDSRKISESLGATSHHENARIALKWSDETYETTFRSIEWNTTRSGLVNPTAVFDTVNIQGSDVSRATLHNLSYIEELELGYGDIIEVYKSNMIIPKVHDNLTRSNTWTYPTECPCCGHNTEIHNANGSKTLHCTNPDCPAKFISKLTNFVGKNGMDIVGLSEQTIELLVDRKYINSFIDLYHLSEYKAELSTLPKQGAKSIAKLLKSIEDSRKVTLDKFLTSLSIPLLGKSTCKDISKYCKGDIDNFIFIVNNTILEFMTIDGIGTTVIDSLDSWWNSNTDMVFELLEEIEIIIPEEKKETSSTVDLSNKIFVITGSLNHFENRDQLKELLESLGAKVSGSVSAKTFALICNDKDSNTGKSKKARDIGVNVWTEDELLVYIGVNNE